MKKRYSLRLRAKEYRNTFVWGGNLQSSNINLLFIKYLWPAFLSALIQSVLIMIDSMFIGQGIGPMGLAAVGLSMPLQTVFTGLAVMVGVGGAALMSMEFGKGNISAGQSVFRQALIFIFITAVIIATVEFIWLEDIVQTLGAQGKLVDMATDYLSIMFIFFILHALIVVLTVFIVNDNNPFLPMIAMFFGAVTSVSLGYLFIFILNFGIQGAAFSAVCAQIAILSVLLIHFWIGVGHLRFKFDTLVMDRIKEILHIGSPIFLLEATSVITMLIFNYVLLNQYSEQHLAAYGITMNLALVLLLSLNSIGQACQPILSFCYGQNDHQRIQAVLKLGLSFTILFGLAATAFVLFNIDWVVYLYTNEHSGLHQLASEATQLYFIAAVLLGINLISASFFQAIKRPNLSILISLSRSFICVLVGLMVLPKLFPDKGIWLLPLVAELITCFLSFLLIKRYIGQKETAIIH